ncbi:MAG: hypothetical protein WC887_00300 [Candidatus Paceibacterota bacterium]|jgi:hypothetical protein
MRRLLITFITLLALIGIGVAVYFYFFANQASVVVAPTNTSLPTAGQTVFPLEPANLATTTDKTTLVAARLIQISTGPVVPGEAVVAIPAANASSSLEIAVNYIERQSGNVFSYQTRTGTLIRTNNKTVPGIQSAEWLPDASFAFVQYLSGTDFSTINTYALPASSNNTGGFFLPQNLTDVAVSSTSVLMLASGVNGSAASVAHTDGTHVSEAFTTPLSSLRVSFAGKNYLAFTKPSATLAGNAFIVTKGHFSRIAGPLYGLMALSSPSGKWVVVSYTQDTAIQMELVNTETNEAIQLPVATIADKCVWAADDSAFYCGIPVSPASGYAYPDDWYQGAVHFSDRIWKIDVVDRQAQLVLDFPKETKGSLDAIALAIDPLATTLAFINKNDGSLWSYSL